MTSPFFDLSKTRHELRTPINHILGYCEMLLEEEGLPERFYQDLGNIHSSGKRLLELIAVHFDERTVADPKDLQVLQHDLRTPVNHIIGYSELLEDFAVESGLDRVVPDLNRIREAARQWLTLMEELLIPVEAVQDPNLAEKSAHAPMLAFVTPGITFQTVRPRVADEPAHWKARILVVDDDAANRDLLARRLQRYGATVDTADDGLRALQLLRQNPFDLVLLDMLMPGLDGYQVLAKVKADANLREVPVIMISGLDQENGIARCLEAGAEDYLTKPFNSVFLKARIGACLERKHWRDQERAAYQALLQSQKHLASELAEAAAYVRSLLPAPLTGPMRADWRFIPCSQLGGDVLGYHWLDENHFAMFVVDVCGHGLGAAFLSISVLNALRSQTLPVTDFRDPASVLTSLNARFPMDQQNQMYFTIWYGVYRKTEHELVYASGGHPPAILFTGEDADGARLRTPGGIVGFIPESRFTNDQRTVPPGSRFYVFSDGAFELSREDGGSLQVSDLAEELRRPAQPGSSKLDDVVAWARRTHAGATFDDDVTVVEVVF